MRSYPVLDPVSQAYPRVGGRSPTCYSPVRRSCTPKGLTARLACVKHAASVRPEPGSNSPTKTGPQKTALHHDTQPATQNTSNWHNTTSPNKKLDTLLSSQKTPAHRFHAHERSIEASRSCNSHRTPRGTRGFAGVPLGWSAGLVTDPRR